MKKNIHHLFLCLLLLIAHFTISAQQCVWANVSACRDGAESWTVSTDRFGNAYIAGNFSGDSMTIGSTVVHNSDISGGDIFAAKYDSTGTVIWLRGFGGRHFAQCYHAVADLDGNFFIYGTFSDTITFGTSTFAAGSYSDIFLAKLEPSGNINWARQISSPGGAWATDPYASGVAVDNNGHVFIAGYSNDTLIFDSTNKTIGMFVAKYDTSGNIQWVVNADAPKPRHIATDNFGNVFVTGLYQRDTVRFNGIYLTGSIINSGFIVKYNGLGNAVWARSEKSDIWVESTNVATDLQGNVFNSGYYFGTALTVGATAFPNPDTNHQATFISKYDSSGNVLWVRAGTGPGPGYGYPWGIATDQSGDVIVSGSCDSLSMTFGASTVSNATCYMVKYTGAGNLSWLWKPDTGFLEPLALAIDNNGNLFVAGDTHTPILKMGAVSVAFPPFSGYEMILAKFNRLSLGVEEINKIKSDVNIYPNPSKNIINIVSDTPIETIAIYDNIGRTIYSRSFTSEMVNLDISYFLPGNYIVAINGIIVKRFTKF